MRQKDGLHYFVINTSKWPRLGFSRQNLFFPGQWIELDEIPPYPDKTGKNGQNWKKKITFHDI